MDTEEKWQSKKEKAKRKVKFVSVQYFYFVVSIIHAKVVDL